MAERHELRLAAEAAARAGAAALAPWRERDRTLEVAEKGAHDFVTAADHAAQHAIEQALRARYPGHRFLGEEGEQIALDLPEPTWIVDPLDGTTNFIHGYPVFGVSVACAIGGEVVAGAVLDVSRDELFSAARGAGATLGGTPIRVSDRNGLGGCLIATGFPFRRLPRLEHYLATFRSVLPKVAGIRRAGSAALDLAQVACGRFDGFWEEGLGPWDIAAGALLIDEAGGVVTDFVGGRRFLESGAIVAGGPGVHEVLRELVEAGQGDGR